MILPKISHFHKNSNFSSIFATFKTNFIAGTCQEYSFSFLPVVSRSDEKHKHDRHYFHETP